MQVETDDPDELGRRAEAMSAARARFRGPTVRAPSLRQWHDDPQLWLAQALDHTAVGDGYVALMGRRVARLARAEFGTSWQEHAVAAAAPRRLGTEGAPWAVFGTHLVDAGNQRKLVEGGGSDGVFVADDEAWLALANLWGPRGPRLLARFVLDETAVEATAA